MEVKNHRTRHFIASCQLEEAELDISDLDFKVNFKGRVLLLAKRY